MYFVESHDLPLLDVSVEFPAGSSRDAPDVSGLASLTLRLLRLGADGMNEDAIARKLADVGANLSASFDVDRAGYALRTLSSETEQRQALNVLSRVLQAPSFPDEVLEREKARVIAGLKESETKPETIAARAFTRLLYRDHPYALRGSGELKTLAALTLADLVGFHRRHYFSDRAVVAIMGDVSRTRAGEIAEELTRDLPKSTTPLPPAPLVPPLPMPIETDIDHPSAQAHILIGQPGLKRDDPDYFALWISNYVLGGGGFTSRLYDQVREKRGLSYSVSSYFSPINNPVLFKSACRLVVIKHKRRCA